jgi:orotidine-5'-phosphate decarboxylase
MMIICHGLEGPGVAPRVCVNSDHEVQSICCAAASVVCQFFVCCCVCNSLGRSSCWRNMATAPAPRTHHTCSAGTAVGVAAAAAAATAAAALHSSQGLAAARARSLLRLHPSCRPSKQAAATATEALAAAATMAAVGRPVGVWVVQVWPWGRS